MSLRQTRRGNPNPGAYLPCLCCEERQSRPSVDFGEGIALYKEVRHAVQRPLLL